MKYKLVSNEKDKRIDKYLAENTDLSRSQIKNLIESKEVFVNNKTIKSSYKVDLFDEIVFSYIEEQIKLIPKEMDLDIVYEDEDLLVINKQKDLIIHPANNDQQDTLVNGLLFRYEKLGNMDSNRPGIVHRLDKDTSGLLVVAKNDFTYETLVEAFSKRQVKRRYYALVHGQVNGSVLIDKPIGRNERDRIKFGINFKNGKKAVTKISPLKVFESYSLLDVELFTGRTHQIRVHLESLGHPVVGDLFYGNKNEFSLDSQLLHCYYLKFTHPRTKEEIKIRTDLPEYFLEILRRIENESNLKWSGNKKSSY